MNSSNASDTLHAHNMYPNLNEDPSDARIVYPYAERNKEPVLQAISPYIQPRSRVFELASGSGQHIVHWAKAFPSAQFQPSEIDDPLLHASIRSYIGEHPNVLPPLTLNAASDADWNRAHSLVRETGAFDMVYVGNVLHIAPWEVTVGLAKNVSKLLAKPRGLFVVYGPFKRDGAFTTSSNEEFDRNLRQRNGDWGLRDISDVANEFAKHNLSLQDIKDMPANNFILVFANTQ